jgi:fused signal recognition particle receptor
MFKFLKEKLKKAVESVKEKISSDDEIIKEQVEIEENKDNNFVKKINEENKSVENIKEKSESEREEIPKRNSKEGNDKRVKEEINKNEEILEAKEEKLDESGNSIKEENTKNKINKEIVNLNENNKKNVENKKTGTEEKTKTEEKQKKSFFSKLKDKITTVQLSESKFDDIFWELEVGLLENNVAMEVIEKIKDDLKVELVNKHIPAGDIERVIINSLRNSISQILTFEKIDIVEYIKSHEKPVIILFLGINGTGKTTTIAKFINLFKKNNITSVVSASDTFRAAAIDQLKEHTDKLGVKLIRHDYGADPAAVAFDAIKYAKAKGIDVVLIDTAGRLHSNTNLMDELKKIIRISNPNLKIFIGDALTGNDCVEQATIFNDIAGIDAIVISKADADEKGGTALSVSYVTGKPLIYLGTGQDYNDLEPFNKEKIISTLGL